MSPSYSSSSYSLLFTLCIKLLPQYLNLFDKFKLQSPTVTQCKLFSQLFQPIFKK